MFPPGTRGRARGLPYTMDAFMLGMGMLSESHTHQLTLKYTQTQHMLIFFSRRQVKMLKVFSCPLKLGSRNPWIVKTLIQVYLFARN